MNRKQARVKERSSSPSPGGFQVDLRAFQDISLSEVLGDISTPLTYTAMQEKLWNFLRNNDAIKTSKDSAEKPPKTAS